MCDEIAEAVLVHAADAREREHVPSVRAASLSAGAAGQAMFLAEYARATRDALADDGARALACAAADATSRFTASSSLYGGFAGIALAVQLAFDALDGRDEAEAAPELASALALAAAARGEYDLILGTVGVGAAALSLRAYGAVRAAVQTLQRTAERPAPGHATWFTPAERLPSWQRATAPNGWYNLGVAHGVPGVISFLASVVAATGDIAARDLLGDAVPWLLAQRLLSGEPSAFPGWVYPGVRTGATRVGWCYGDLGVAVALLAAARAAREPAWEAEAVALARDASRRRGEDTGVIDPYLCHGAAGVGHLFNRLAQATGDGELRAAARWWFGEAVALWREQGCAASARLPVAASPDVEQVPGAAGFLVGAAGVGLALLAALGGDEPAWDHALLSAIPS